MTEWLLKNSEVHCTPRGSQRCFHIDFEQVEDEIFSHEPQGDGELKLKKCHKKSPNNHKKSLSTKKT